MGGFMSNKKTGGPAFPSKKQVFRAGFSTSEYVPVDGMTLRDYFAAHATEEDIHSYMWKSYKEEYVYTKPDGTKEMRVRQACYTREESRYIYADRMLKARAA
jgi:hypothetical protein